MELTCRGAIYPAPIIRFGAFRVQFLERIERKNLILVREKQEEIE